MEYCEHGDLKSYLADVKTLPESQVHEIAPQILGALASMHESGFAHRDLKPAVGSITLSSGVHEC
jgi:calcium/calmodulin-dependent protein kinase I